MISFFSISFDEIYPEKADELDLGCISLSESYFLLIGDYNFDFSLDAFELDLLVRQDSLI